MSISCNTFQKEEQKTFLKKKKNLRTFVAISNCLNLHTFPLPLTWSSSILPSLSLPFKPILTLCHPLESPLLGRSPFFEEKKKRKNLLFIEFIFLANFPFLNPFMSQFTFLRIFLSDLTLLSTFLRTCLSSFLSKMQILFYFF